MILHGLLPVVAALLLGVPGAPQQPGAKQNDPKDKVARIGQIIITGNDQTPDRLILKHLKFYPGQVLDYKALRAAEKRLAGMKCFVVDPAKGIRPTVTVIESDGEFKDILVKVQEAKKNAGQYYIRFYFFESRGAGKPALITCPQVVTLPGQPAKVFCGQQVVPPENTGTGELVSLEVGTSTRVCVYEMKSGDLRLTLAVDSTELKPTAEKDNALATGYAVRALRKFKLNERQKMVLATGADGMAGKWLEVVVSDHAIDQDPTPFAELAPAGSSDRTRDVRKGS
jgi:hypothetical protein